MIRKKMVLNKRTLIVASSFAAIPLAVVLIATATRRARRKSLQTSRFLGKTSSKTGVITSAADRLQQNEKSQLVAQSPWRGSETKATATIDIIPIKTNIADKDATNSAAIPSPLVPSTASDSVVVISPQTPKEEEISVSDEARKAGESLKELIMTAIKEAKDSAKGTGKRLKEQTINVATTVDSKDIRSLGDNVNIAARLFEEVMIEIRKEPYDEQIKLLDSYKDLLQTHINVVNARGRMASKLKPGA
jgi:enamine deaminase RidA (YjgF/YER057c/UK114 family)